MQGLIPTVVVIKNGVVDSAKAFKGTDETHRAEQCFMEKAKEIGCDIDEYFDDHLDDGYVESHIGAVCLTWVEIEEA